MYHVFNPRKQTYLESLVKRYWDDSECLHPVVFDTKAEAEAKALEATAETGERHVVHDMYWQNREALRFDNGIYRRPGWHKRSFWRNRDCELVKHYCHVSLKNPELVAFTVDEMKGRADIQTPMKPGAYLKKFFGDTLSQEQIKELVELHKLYVAGGELPVPELSFATTADDICAVYEGGPSSCMDGEHCFSGGSPVRVYAAGDLAIAYLGDKDTAEARALCWPAKKVYGRVYPDPEDGDGPGADLVRALDAAGFAPAGRTGFNGAKLSKLPHRGFGERYVMPYLDRCYNVDDEGRYFTMHSSGAIEAQQTCGYIELEPEHDYQCEACDDGCDNVWQVYLSRHRSQDWCESCRDNDAFYCSEVSEYVSDNAAITIEGELVAEWVDHAEVIVSLDGVTENWLEASVEERAFRCNVTGECYVHALASPETLGRPLDTEGHPVGGWVGTFIGVDGGQKAYVSTDPAQMCLLRTMTEQGLNVELRSAA